MVVVKIELWPHGDESTARPLGVIKITNDGAGDAERGNYAVELSHAGHHFGRPGNYRTGHVVGYLRRLSPYHLIAKALAAAGIR